MTRRIVNENPALRVLRLRREASPLAVARPLTFRQFVDLTTPHFVWYRHCEVLAGVLQRAADRELKRVMIFMPPRHGKSELVSRLFSAYWLYRYPSEWVGLASYSADLAEDLSDNARENFRSAGGVVKRTSASKKLWKTWSGGGLWASGVGGSMTGKGFTLGIIDDPLKNAEESNSETIRRKIKEWYQSVFYTRAHPDECIVILLTRWHEDDLAGWQLTEEAKSVKEDGEQEGWHVVNFEAVRDFDLPPTWPSSCTLEPDWRRHGDALCPERYPESKLRRIKERIGTYFFSALYQQRPSPAGGGILQEKWFAHRLHISQIPAMRRIVLGCDLAVSSKTGSDFTVAYPLGADHVGRYYLFRPYRAQAEAPAAIAGIAGRAMEVKAKTVGVESVSLGIGLIQHLRLRPEMIGRAVVGIAADRDKETRARGWSPIAEQGLITLVLDGSGWEEEFLKEVRDFPRGKHDDQIDSVGMGFATLAETGDFGVAAGGDGRQAEVRKGLRN